MPEPHVDLFSPIYRRYNGFLLGVFMLLAGLEYVQPRYSAARARMEEFLAEIGVDVPIPAGREDFTSFDPGRVIRGIGDVDFELAQFVTLASWVASGTTASPQLQAAAHQILDEHGLTALVTPADLTAMQAAAREAVSVNAVISQALSVVTTILSPLEAEANTVFVIMPFRSPFTERYSTFYRPLLHGLGARCIRAWGGLGEEEFQGSMLRLIEKCGMVMADVTGANANVMYELGAAQGQGKPAMIVVEGERPGTTRRGIPANIGNQNVLAYDPSRPDWERELLEILRAGDRAT